MHIIQIETGKVQNNNYELLALTDEGDIFVGGFYGHAGQFEWVGKLPLPKRTQEYNPTVLKNYESSFQ